MRCFSWLEPAGSIILSFLHDYESLQSLAVALIYIQIGCALIGSPGAVFNGVLVANLVVALFALVAIESRSQRLGRIYALLLFFVIILDVAWFILFSETTRDIYNNYGKGFAFSLSLALWMQTIGLSVRLFSSFVWIQMYRLGALASGSAFQIAEYGRSSFLSPTTGAVRPPSVADEVLGGSIYNPAYYSSLFEDASEINCTSQVGLHISNSYSSTCSAVQSPHQKTYSGKHILV